MFRQKAGNPAIFTLVKDLTLILDKVSTGDIPADALLPLVYQELRNVAAQKMSGEAPGNTLQATALVHEAWLRLGGEAQNWRNRAHFFGAAAEAMRRILIDRARSKRTEKHGGGLERVDLAGLEIMNPSSDEDLLAVDEALGQFVLVDAEKAELVKLRYFAGMTLEEAAEVLGLSLTTAKRHWAYAKAWLYRAITTEREHARS